MLQTILIRFDAPAAPGIPIPVTIYQICIFVQHRGLELGVTGLSLVYGTLAVLLKGGIPSDHAADFLAFSVIVFLVVRSNARKVPLSRLFKIIVQDATYYFLIIFSSHLVLEFTIFLARVSGVVVISYLCGLGDLQPSLQLLPAT